MSAKPSFHKREENRGKSISAYWPLFALIAITALAATALLAHTGGAMLEWMHYFMGFFLCCFAMLKLFHPSSFADGFEMYDILAKNFRPYGYVYPYIELGLGLAYLAFLTPQITYILTAVVMVFGSIGVLHALRQGLNINCPCMGSILNVPLSTVTLTEDLGMAAMAITMIFMSQSMF